MARPGLWGYVKAAFKVPYNVILFTGGMLAGIVTLQPHVVWPFVVAAEVLYLASLSGNRRFQATVDARDRSAAAGDSRAVADRLLAALSPERQQRFEAVLRRCRDLQGPLDGRGDRVTGILEGQQTQAVNQLLWVFLRTLAHEQALAAFCENMPRQEIEQTLERTERALAGSDLSEEMRAAHTQNAEVLRQRLDNLRRAEQNLEAIEARLVRVENSIMLIQEQALTRRDPGFVEAEVRSVTAGLDSVEEMMRSMDLPQVTSVSEDLTPEFLGAQTRRKQGVES